MPGIKKPMVTLVPNIQSGSQTWPPPEIDAFPPLLRQPMGKHSRLPARSNDRDSPFTFRFLTSFILVAIGSFSPSYAQQTVTYEKAVLTAIYNSTIASPDPGIVQVLPVIAGQDVVRGDTIATLNREIYVARLRVATEEEQIAILESENDVSVMFATKQTEVNRKLMDRSSDARQRYPKSVMLTQLDRIQLELEQSQLSIKQAKLQLEIAGKTATLRARLKEVADLNLKNREILVPVDGRVAQVFVQKGMWVNAGQPIARIINLEKLRVQGVFNKDYAYSIKRGDDCIFQFTIADKTTSLRCKVTYVGSEIVEDIFQVWADVDSPDLKLVPGVRGRMTIKMGGRAEEARE